MSAWARRSLVSAAVAPRSSPALEAAIACVRYFCCCSIVLSWVALLPSRAEPALPANAAKPGLFQLVPTDFSPAPSDPLSCLAVLASSPSARPIGPTPFCPPPGATTEGLVLASAPGGVIGLAGPAGGAD